MRPRDLGSTTAYDRSYNPERHHRREFTLSMAVAKAKRVYRSRTTARWPPWPLRYGTLSGYSSKTLMTNDPT